MAACFEENKIDITKVLESKTPYEFDHYFTR